MPEESSHNGFSIIERIESLTSAARRDLTSGPIGAGVLSLAVPVIASNLLHSIQSLVDMFFVGRLGKDAIAAVGMAGTVIMILVTIFMGLNTATVAMISRASGAGDRERVRHVSGQALLLTAVFSAIVGVGGYLSSPYLLAFLGAEASVVELGTGYLHVIFGGIFLLVSIFIISAIFQGTGDTATPLLLGILTTACNVVLNPILIFGLLGVPALGVRGSAVATVIARAVSLAAGIALLARGRLNIRMRDVVPDPKTIWRVVAIGIPGTFQMSIRMLMNLVIMTIVAKFGTAAIAAYTVGLRIRMVGLFPSFGFGASAATMVGQNLGADRPERSKRSALVATGMALVVSSTAAVVFSTFAPFWVRLFNNDPGVVAVGTGFLRITSVVLATASIGIVLGRAMNGAGDTVSPMVITLVMLWGFQIPAAVYLSGIRELWGISIPLRHVFEGIAAGNENGVWYAMVAASALQAVVTVFWFLRGRWKDTRA